MRPARSGFSVLEVLIAASLTVTLFALAASYARPARAPGVVAAVELQYEARLRIAGLVRALEDSTELVRPAPGATLDYFVVRDRRNHLLVGYPVERPGSPAARELRLFRRDTSPAGRETGDSVLLPLVHEVQFTSLAPDLLQVRVVLGDDGARFPILTAIRFRNAGAEALP